MIAHASDTDGLATRVPDSHGVYMVPAFVGLGRAALGSRMRAGAIFGLTLDATGAHLARAALEATAYQTRDLIAAMVRDGCASPAAIRVDGGMTANDWLCQFLADILDVPVERPANLETTALGAAFHAGLATGVWSGLDELSRTWAAADRFESRMESEPAEQAGRRLGRRGRPDAQPALTIVTCATSITPPRKPPSQYIR